MRASVANPNAVNAFRLRETLSAPDLRPLSNSGLKNLVFPRLSGFSRKPFLAILREYNTGDLP
jgi:hypothetical protein